MFERMQGPTQGRARARTYRYRLVGLGSALALVAGMAAWTVQSSWTKLNSLERRLTAGRLESFRLASEFEQRLRTLNHLVLSFAAGRDAAAPGKFRQAGEVLKGWMERYDPERGAASDLTTEAERRVMPRLNEVFDEYREAAEAVLAVSPSDLMPAGVSAPLDRFEQLADRLVALGDELAEAHREAEDGFLARAYHELAGLRVRLMTAIAVMLVLVGALGVVLYRDLVRPLRIRLGESEALLERQEKLATLGTLAAGIAHEIRNPLTSIKARLYTLGKHIRGNTPGLEDAEVIGGEIARLERIVQDVLSFARPSEPRKAVVPAEAPLREVQALMAAELERRGTRLVLEPVKRLLVAMDVALMKQVVINLVRNASEAIAGPGTVTLRVRSDRARLRGVDQAVAVLEVTDTGKGMQPEVEARLFDPFFTTKEAGTGLGLSIAARIVEKHGGWLRYETRPGHGTTFGIVLPEVRPTADAGEPGKEPGRSVSPACAAGSAR